MPKCTRSLDGQGPAYDYPPTDILRGDLLSLYDYLVTAHTRLFGTADVAGDLDNDNINAGSIKGIDHANLIDVLDYQHHGAGSHKDLDQAAAVDDASASGAAASTAAAASVVAITSADPDGTYSANEQALLLELKTDVNTLVDDVNNIEAAVNANAAVVTTLTTALDATIAKLNALLAALRAAKVVAE